jgi:hypothetical protein
MKPKFELTKEEIGKLNLIVIEGNTTTTGIVPLVKGTQERINDYWDELAQKYNFNVLTVDPIDNTHFYAVKGGG